MSAKKSVFKVLQTQKEMAESESVAELKKSWMAALTDLFSQIRKWTTEAEKRGLLKVRTEAQGFREERIGNYVADVMFIAPPSGIEVKISPKARFVYGANGRVDIECTPLKATLILNEKKHLAARRINFI